MKTITSILVPTDFSPVALNAYAYALQLADAFDARIDLLYAIPPVTDSPGYGSFLTHMPEEGRKELAAFLNEGIARVKDRLRHPPRVATFVPIGDLRFAIRGHVEQEGNQLVVMGTAGRQDGWDDFLGTNASYLVNRAPCPVLVVPQHVRYQSMESVCFATDLHDVGTFQAGKVIRALRPFTPEVHFLHVRTDDREVTNYDLNLLRDVFDRPERGLRASFTDRAAEDIVGAIFAYAFENQCDLVVLHRPDRPWFHRLLVKSNTREAVLRARLPLLIITAADLAATDRAAHEAIAEQS